VELPHKLHHSRRVSHAWVVQHTSIREVVHELKGQTAILAEILHLLRSRTH
jgi:hypothetical protein